MNLEGLDVFVKVVQLKSFTAAARALGMPATTVSGKIALLEKKLGSTLIQRTTRKLNITRAGSILYHHSVRALDEITTAENALSINQMEPEGKLRITAPPDVGHTLLPSVIEKYLLLYPKTNIELVLTNRIVDLIGENVDLAIRVGPLKDSNLIAKKFIHSSAGLWASPAYIKKNGQPKSPKDLFNHNFIQFTGDADRIQLNSGKEKIYVKINSRISVDDMESIKVFTIQGNGIGILPSFLCEGEDAKDLLIQILPTWTAASFNLYFVFPAQKFISVKTKYFMELFK